MPHHERVTGERPLSVTDVDDGLADELESRIIEFNEETTGIRDGRLLCIALRDGGGDLEAGLTGWTWGGTAYVDLLWVRADLRGAGLGSRMLDAVEAEAEARGCTQVLVSSHTFQAPSSTAGTDTWSTRGSRTTLEDTARCTSRNV